MPWFYHGPCPINQGNTIVLLGENVLLPWWMMPFSRRAWPRLIPSSALLISPLSKSHETNSLRIHRDNSCISLHITQHSTHAREGIYEPLVKGTWELGFTQFFRVTAWSKLIKSSQRTQIKMISRCIPLFFILRSKKFKHQGSHITLKNRLCLSTHTHFVYI